MKHDRKLKGWLAFLMGMSVASMCVLAEPSELDALRPAHQFLSDSQRLEMETLEAEGRLQEALDLVAGAALDAQRGRRDSARAQASRAIALAGSVERESDELRSKARTAMSRRVEVAATAAKTLSPSLAIRAQQIVEETRPVLGRALAKSRNVSAACHSVVKRMKEMLETSQPVVVRQKPRPVRDAEPARVRQRPERAKPPAAAQTRAGVEAVSLASTTATRAAKAAPGAAAGKQAGGSVSRFETGRLLEEAGDYEEALDEYGEWLERETAPGGDADRLAAVRSVKERLELARVLVARAERRLKASKPAPEALQEAGNLLAGAALLAPGWRNVLLAKGHLAMARKAYPEAIASYTAAVKTRPRAAAAHGFLALAHFRLACGQEGEARRRSLQTAYDAGNEAVRLRAEHPTAAKDQAVDEDLLGVVAYNLKRFEDAGRHLGEAVRLDPSSESYRRHVELAAPKLRASGAERPAR
ncbi:MAG: hypothetical protein HY814_04075 [Candidatus Riflebacteria bacterium]|nr:hypothetical protein [Candidatus Riflebacteria bacterium]